MQDIYRSGLALVAAVLMLSTSNAMAGDQVLFNGKDLTGWDGAPGWWRPGAVRRAAPE